jgi:hypothetical protein
MQIFLYYSGIIAAIRVKFLSEIGYDIKIRTNVLLNFLHQNTKLPCEKIMGHI